MKLASFYADGRERIGVASADGSSLIELPSGGDHPRTVLELIEGGEAAWAAAKAAGGGKAYAVDEVQWRAPVRTPSKIVCLALNNSANASRIMKGPKHPATFIKPWSALIGHGEAVLCKPHYGRCHPEPELAVVIGKGGKDIAAENAYDHVFGYTAHNDITSPTMRDEDTFFYRAIHPKGGDAGEIEYVDSWVSYPGRYKASDTFSCLGPYIVTKDEIADPHDLRVACYHNDRLVTEDNTRNLTHHIPAVIAFVSSYMTLIPGDVISMGTALQASAKGGAVQNVDMNKFGGTVSVEIEGIGKLTNGVRWE